MIYQLTPVKEISKLQQHSEYELVCSVLHQCFNISS